MHLHTLDKWRHPHDFAVVSPVGERRVKLVFWLTITAMAGEIAGGAAFGSMSLLADGWHMGTHATAFAIALFAYWYAKTHASDRRFAFGTGKVGDLGAFASAVALAGVALVMAVESLTRLFHPRAVAYDEAILVSVLGLGVNLACAALLHHQDVHTHHRHLHDDAAELPFDTTLDEDHHHTDHNIRGAYLHVLADMLTSLLAIAALSLGKYIGFWWLDPAIGLVGAAVISRWSLGLVKDTSAILLDNSMDHHRLEAIRNAIESEADNRISDIHVWKISPDDHAAMISIVTHFPEQPSYYKGLLRGVAGLSHVTVEVNQCMGEPCMPLKSRGNGVVRYQ